MKEKKKKRPFDTVRVTSIARKINLNYMGRLFMTYITTDVLVFVLLAGIFIVGMDLQMAGNFSFRYTREFSYKIDFWNALYTVSDSSGQVLYQIPVGVWLNLLRMGGVILIAAQLLDLIMITVWKMRSPISRWTLWKMVSTCTTRICRASRQP